MTVQTIYLPSADDVTELWRNTDNRFFTTVTDRPEFVYTVGLERRFREPELLLTGFANEEATNLLQEIAEACYQRQYWQCDLVLRLDWRRRVRVIGNHDLSSQFPLAAKIHNGPFRLVQCFISDKRGRFPYETGFNGTPQYVFR